MSYLPPDPEPWVRGLLRTIRYRRDPELFYTGLLFVWLGGLVVGLSLGLLLIKLVLG